MNKEEVQGITNRLLSFATIRIAQKTTRPTSLTLLRVYLLPRERVYVAFV
jgi:hypothetical protein